jgi:hypothetical protein
MEMDGGSVEGFRCLRKCRYRMSFEGRQVMGEWWMEKRAWGSWMSLVCARTWVRASLGFEEEAQSTVAAVDLEATLRREGWEIRKLKRRKRASDWGSVA